MKKLVEYMELPQEDRQSHIDLDEPCVVRGTTSTHCRGILAYYLDTDMNSMRVDCCHACNNEACSNPKHLYWGTRSENMRDLHIFNPDVAKKYGARGEKNGNYGVMPWRNIGAITSHPAMKKMWMDCEKIYKEYYLAGWDYSAYGKGETYFAKTYGYSRATVAKMWKMFRNGWNPLEDEDYQLWRK